MAGKHSNTHAAGTGPPGVAGKAMGLASAGVAALTLPIYLTTLAIASSLFHKLATADAAVTGLLSPIAVFAAVLLTLIAASIGASSCILGIVLGICCRVCILRHHLEHADRRAVSEKSVHKLQSLSR